MIEQNIQYTERFLWFDDIKSFMNPFFVFGENMVGFMSIVCSNCLQQTTYMKQQALYDFLRIHFYLKMSSASKFRRYLKI